VKRLAIILTLSLLTLGLSGCGKSDEEKFTESVGKRLAAIETRVGQAYQAKDNLDGDLRKVQTTAIQLQQDAKSLQASIESLNTSLMTLQEEINNLKQEQQIRAKELSAGGWVKWLIAIIIIIVVAYLAYKLLKPKPFEEEEEEDFSSFDEDLGFEEGEEESEKLEEGDLGGDGEDKSLK